MTKRQGRKAYYRVVSHRYPGAGEVLMTVSDAVMNRAREGDDSARANLAIRYRKLLEQKLEHSVEPVQFRDLHLILRF